MEDLTVSVGLLLVEKAISYLDQKFNHPSDTNVRGDVERAWKCLRRMQAYLRDSEDIDAGSQRLQNRVKEVQSLAYEIEDALDEFICQVPHHFHSNIFSEMIHDSAYFLKERRAISELSSKIKHIETTAAYLRDSEDIDAGSQRLQNRVKEVQSLAYEIEDALDEFICQVPHHFHSNIFSEMIHDSAYFLKERRAISELSSKIKHIETTVGSFTGLDSLLHEPPPSSSSIMEDNLTHQVLEEDEILGFEEPKQRLLEQLMEANSKLLTILIVGPGGSGKTTIVKNVYDSKMVQRFFDCHAWVDVSRPPELAKLLRNMSIDFRLKKSNTVWSKYEAERQIVSIAKLRLYPQQKVKRQEPVHEEEEEEEEAADPKEELKLFLKAKRFLLVLDNVWRAQDLESIVNALPKGLPGSKIIVTSRKSNIASVASKYIHDLSCGLSRENAWYLFCKKAFQNNEGNCPPELKHWAIKILRKCEGLPLAISAVSTLLGKKPQTPVEWKKLHESLGSEIRPDSGLSVISRILQPSYMDLPSHLKTCFLYFAMFPEDYSISRERLIRLWLAEGFVMRGRGKTMEEVAESYLNELIGRNLVYATRREIDGRVRSCRVLSLVREFIISQAEDFITVLEPNCTTTTSGEKIRRLSVQNVDINLLVRDRDLSKIRTLLVFGKTCSPSDLEMVLKTSKYLRVFDFQGVPFKTFPKNVTGLHLLRYLSLRQTKITSVPKSIHNLAFLQTLDLKYTKVTKLPKTIYKLQSMRHLLVCSCDMTSGVTRGVEVSAGNIGTLSSIEKLLLVKVKKNRKAIKALRELIGLRKLGLVDLGREHGRELCCSIQKMPELSILAVRSTSEDEYLDLDHMNSPPGPPLYLQRLSLTGRLESLPQWIPQLHSLARIALRGSKLNAGANTVEVLQDLPNLMELELIDYYTGTSLTFKAEKFKKLKTLRIEQFDQLDLMAVEVGAMPQLKRLTMSKCQNLKLLPFGIDRLIFLEELLLYHMHHEFLRRLQKDSEDRYMVENIRVIHSFCGSYQSYTGFQNLS